MILVGILATIGVLAVGAFWGAVLAEITIALQNKDKRGENEIH